MSAETVRWYPSKIDRWIVPILFLSPVASIVVCVALVFSLGASGLAWGLPGVLLVLGIYLGLLFPMRYGLDDTHLHVRFGLCRQRIPLADISEVYPTRNPLSSPALSLDRLHMQYGQGIFEAVMISPADRNGFLDDLAQRAGLKRKGDRLVRV